MIETVKRIHFKELQQRPIEIRTMTDVPDKCILDVETETGGGGKFVVGVTLDREAVLELRDCLDAIMRDWFCEPDPVRQRMVDTGHIEPTDFTLKHMSPEDVETAKAAIKRMREKLRPEPLVFSPAEVAQLDRPVGLGMEEDEVEEARRTT